jgi:hypothetical protein
MKNTKFYEFSQNNSGGHFDVDENVCHRVIIEATNERHSISIAKEIGIYFDGCAIGVDCSCCGDRWYDSPDEIDIEQYREGGYPAPVYNSEEKWFTLYGEFPRHTEPEWNNKYGFKEFEGSVYFETIEQYAQFLANRWGSTTPDVIIHYLDGTKKKFFKKDY